MDSSDNIYLTGFTNSTDFDLLNEIEVEDFGTGVMVVKMEQSNSVPSLAFSTFVSPGGRGTGIAVDSGGGVYVTGNAGVRFTLLNEIQGYSFPNDVFSYLDIFLFKLEQTNNVPVLAFSTYLGGRNGDSGTDIEVDDSGDIHLTGYTRTFIGRTLQPPNTDEGNELPELDEPNAIGIPIFQTDFPVYILGQVNNVPSIEFSTVFENPNERFFTGILNGIAVDSSRSIYLASPNRVTKIVQEGGVPDTTPPTITPPSDVAAEATGPFSSPPLGTPTVTDNVSLPENISVIASPPGQFPLGLTEVSWIAIDEAGNIATASQNVTIVDTTSPLITLLGANPVFAEKGQPYIDPWASAVDLVDGVVPLIVNSQPGATLGTFEVVFSATDSNGNTGTATRVVIPVDTTPPVITILGDNPINAQVGQPYNDPGATAVDSLDGSVQVTLATQIGAAPGTFEVVYSATDSADNTATATRVVVVVP